MLVILLQSLVPYNLMRSSQLFIELACVNPVAMCRSSLQVALQLLRRK